MTSYSAWPTVAQQFQNEINKLFERNFSGAREGDNSNIATSQWMPAVDIKEENNRFKILADIPGVHPQDIQVGMENGILTIQGERKHEAEEKGDNYYRKECVCGKFYRRFSLPDSADAENIQAKIRHGVLEVVIPKTQKHHARKVEVKVEE